jgi:hypothetical protein
VMPVEVQIAPSRRKIGLWNTFLHIPPLIEGSIWLRSRHGFVVASDRENSELLFSSYPSTHPKGFDVAGLIGIYRYSVNP